MSEPPGTAEEPSPANPRLAVGIVLTLAAGATLAGMDAIGKRLTEDLNVLMVVWARYAFHTVIAFALLSALGDLGYLRSRRPWAQTGRGATMVVATLLMYWALSSVPLADASAIAFFSPVLVTLLAGVLLKERVGPRRIAAVICGFLGVLLIVRPGFGGTDWHMLLPVGTAVLLAFYLLLTRHVSDVEQIRTTFFYSTVLGAVVLSLAVPFSWQTPTAHQFMLMTAMGGLGALGHFLLVYGFRYAPASVLSPFLYSQLLIATLISVVYFRDPLTLPMMVGTTVLVASGLYIWWRESGGRIR